MSLKARELRLGNLITSDGDVFVVNRIDEEFVHAGAYIISKLGLDNVDYGIPLSEEWLMKFGFEDKRGYEFPSYRKGLLLVYGRPNNEWIYIVGKGMTAFESDPKPLYVHQLQNLYFALTGEELTIKE